MELTNKKWKAFKLSSVLEIENCKCSNVSKLRDGNIPYIGATNRNNGLLKFVEYDETLITKGNCIAFICDGEGSVGASIYKKEDFIGSTTVKVGRNEKLNSHIGFFITTVADKVRSKYNFGFKRNDNHLKNELLLLPINSKDEPDFAFMENYMKQKETELLKQYNKQISEFENVVPLSEKEWKEYELNNLFDIFTGGDLIISRIHRGEIPIISHSISNNGIAEWTAPITGQKLFNAIETISLADRGNFYAFTQGIDFYIGTRVKALRAKFSNPNSYIFQFVCTLINKQAEKFSYGNNATGRIGKLKILLPADTNGAPDYTYMENYMKALESEKIKQYLEYKNKIR